jgi:VWFA-related protein
MRKLLSPTWHTQVGRRNSFHNLNSSHLAVAIVLFFGATLLYGQLAQDSPSATKFPTPAARMELSAIGYHTPSRTVRLSEDEGSVSLDFVDTGHVLLTFSPRKLFQRLPSCPPGHRDRMVHAAIIEVPSGRIVKETDWYLHDRRRYLWPLSPGRFLLRRLNDLYIVDSHFHEQLLLNSPKNLLWVAVTPDGSEIIVETAKDPDALKASQPTSLDAPSKPETKFVARFLDAKTLALRRTVQLEKVVDLNGTSAGYVDLVHKGEIWLIRFGPSPTQRRNIARVRSRTIPDVVYTSNTSLLVGRCPSRSCDYSVTSFTVAGRHLWRQHWSRYRTFPAVARNEENSRFAVSTLREPLLESSSPDSGSPPYDPDDPSQPDPAQRDEQDVQIFETASGNPVLSVKVSLPVVSGQNFSLSPDGRRLAVLQGDALELFDLPQMSGEEQAKFALLKAEVPNLYALASPSSSASSLDAATPQVSNDNEETGKVATDTAVNDVAQKSDDSNSIDDTNNANQIALAEAENSPSASPPTAITEQEMDAKTGPIATFKVNTRAVVVDVVVTDAKGHPVRGLQQQDFHVVEDGKPQEVRSFREFSDGDAPAVADTTQHSAPKSDRNVFSNATAAPDQGAVTMVLFDTLNTPSQDQAYARQQLIKFIESKPKNLQFALCTLGAGASHLRLIQGFTQDEPVLLAAARGNKIQEARWQASATGTRNSVSTVADLAQGGRASGFQNLLGALQGMQTEQLGTDTDERVAVTVDSLMVLSRYLSGIPGRKNVVWLSGEFPIAIAAPIGANDSAADNRNYSEQIKRVTNLLAEAQIAIYPVDVRGLLAGGFSADSSASMAGPPSELPATSSAKILAPENSAAPRGLDELDQQATERATLNQVATATGGKAFYSSNGIKNAIATAVEQGSNYYALSYTSANKTYNGKFRRIKVLLGEKGYSLHYRPGYFAEDANTAAKDADLSHRTRAAAMQHGSPPSRQILFSATVVPVGTKTKMNHNQVGEVLLASTQKPALPPVVEVQHYGIDYSLRGSQLQFIPQQSTTYRNVLTLMVASFDSQGTMLTGISYLGISNLEPSVYRNVIGGEFVLHQEADVPMEAAWLRLGIQDQMSGRIGTVEVPLPIPPPTNAPHRVRHTLPEIEPD